MPRWTEEELENKLMENPGLKIGGVPLLVNTKPLTVEGKPSKYHSTRTEYNGEWYHSKKEAEEAKKLQLLQRQGEIKGFISQVPIKLPGHIVHRVDFLIFNNDCTVTLREVKGQDTPLGKMKRKQVEELYKIKIEVV